MVRRSRVREKLVNPIQLGWVRSWAAMDWSAIPAGMFKIQKICQE